MIATYVLRRLDVRLVMRKHLANIWALLRWPLSSAGTDPVVAVAGTTVTVTTGVDVGIGEAGTGEEEEEEVVVVATVETETRITLGMTTQGVTHLHGTTTAGVLLPGTGTQETDTPLLGAGIDTEAGATAAVGATGTLHMGIATQEAETTTPGGTHPPGMTTAGAPLPWTEAGMTTAGRLSIANHRDRR